MTHEAGAVAEVLSQGPGTRGIIFGKEVGNAGASHAFNVINDGGVVRFLDGQIAAVPDLTNYHSLAFLRTN